MKLLVLSDLHLERRDFRLPANGYDLVILAGDIHSPGRAAVAWAADQLPPGAAAILVPGNHEYYGSTLAGEQAAMHAAARESAGRVHVLDGAGAVIGGVRFLGCTLWTDFALRIDVPGADDPVSDAAFGLASCARALADFRRVDIDDGANRRKLQPQDTQRLHARQRRWLLQSLREPFEGPTVVVTHHGPHRSSLAPCHAADWVSTGFINELPPEFFTVPVLWVHGHTHTSFDYTIGGCRVVCNPHGYLVAQRDENAHFRENMVVEIQVPAPLTTTATPPTP